MSHLGLGSPGQVLKDEYRRLGRPLDGKTKEQVLAMARETLAQKAPEPDPVKSTLVSDAHGTYITGSAASVYLPKSDKQYILKLDTVSGKPYVTNNADYTKWVAEFFPEQIATARPPYERTVGLTCPERESSS